MKLIDILDSLQEVRKDLANLREGLKKIRQELTDNFANVEPSNQYGTKMWAFLKKATALLEELVDDINAAESTFSEVAQFYGEDEKNMTSTEFYGIFKTFIAYYRVSMATCEVTDNHSNRYLHRNARWTTKLLRSKRLLRRRGV